MQSLGFSDLEEGLPTSHLLWSTHCELNLANPFLNSNKEAAVIKSNMSPTTEPPRMISLAMSMDSGDDCHFRILANRSVKYITIEGGTIDADSLDDMPLDFQNILPPLAYHENTWKSACITRNASSGQLEAALSSEKLPGVETIWHPRMIDHLDLERTQYLNPLTHEYKWTADSSSSPERMIAKMARFHWEIQYMEAETRMYQILEGKAPDIAPKFLGHIHEEGRVIGFLLEKIPDGRNAEPADLEICEAALRWFHGLGFVHGDCNKHNFIIRPNGQVVLIDFDKARFCIDPAVLEAEVASLKGQLAETTGRGGGLMAYVDSDKESEK